MYVGLHNLYCVGWFLFSAAADPDGKEALPTDAGQLAGLRCPSAE